MWKDGTRASGKNDCRLDWSGIRVKPLPLVQGAPFDRVAPAAENRVLRESNGVSTTQIMVLAGPSVIVASRKTGQKLNAGSLVTSPRS
jgi:hypothetical protein